MARRLVHILENSDLRGRHVSLRTWAARNGVNLERIRSGDLVAFLNRRKTQLAILVALEEEDSLGLLAWYKSPHGRVPPEAMEFLPVAFGMEGFQMAAALRAGLEKLLARRRPQA